MADNFYAAYPDEKLVNNLFLGWGYNFYRTENQLRADDLMVRARVGEILCTARASVDTAELVFRRAYLPPPSRAQPRHDPEALRRAQALESISRALGALEGQIRALPVPETDHMTQRLRDERTTLDQLLQADRAMVATAEHLRTLVADSPAEAILAREPDLSHHMAALGAALQSRRALLAAK